MRLLPLNPMLSVNRNNRKGYVQSLESYAEVLTEHACKLYLFSSSSKATPDGWRLSIYKALFNISRLNWNGNRFLGDEAKAVVQSIGIDDVKGWDFHLDFYMKSNPGFYTPFRGNDALLTNLAKESFPKVDAFLTEVFSSGVLDDRTTIHACVHRYFSAEAVAGVVGAVVIS